MGTVGQVWRRNNGPLNDIGDIVQDEQIDELTLWLDFRLVSWLLWRPHSTLSFRSSNVIELADGCDMDSRVDGSTKKYY